MNFTLTRGTPSVAFNVTPDSDGDVWIVVEHEGWDTPGFTASAAPLAVAHGGNISPGFLPQRAVGLTGVCKFTDRQRALGKLQAVVNALPGSTMSRLSGPCGADSTDGYLDVYLAMQTKIRHAGAHFEFQLGMVAPFPIRQATATTSQSSATGTFTNAGTAPTPPVLTLGGSGGDVTITNTTVSGAPSLVLKGLAANTVVDFRARTVMVSGVSNYTAVQGASDWWWLASGANSITYSGPTATLSWHNGYY